MISIKGSKPLLNALFGRSLESLLLDDSRSVMSKLEPKLGIPNQILLLIKFIEEHIDTPELFRRRASIKQIEDLLQSIEAEKGTGEGFDVSTVCIVLIKFLNQLPEPLFGSIHSQAFLACSTIEDERERLRNLAILVSDMPWYVKPLTHRLFKMFSQCCHTDHTKYNNLNYVAVSLLIAPSLLRTVTSSSSRQPGAVNNSVSHSDTLMSFAAKGSDIISFMLQHSDEIFNCIEEELSALRTSLTGKIERVKALQELVVTENNIVDMASVEQADICSLLSNLMTGLQQTYDQILQDGSTFNGDQATTKGTEDCPHSPLDLLASPLWIDCGILSWDGANKAVDPNAELAVDVLQGRWREFSGKYGLAALRCLLNFFNKYKQKAVSLAFQFWKKRRAHCRLGHVLLRLVYLVADCLHLTHPGSFSYKGNGKDKAGRSLPSVHAISAAEPLSWQLLNHADCFQELFDVALLTFDDIWASLTYRTDIIAEKNIYAYVLVQTKTALTQFIAESGGSFEILWEKYISYKLQCEEFAFKQKPSAPKILLRHKDEPHAVNKDNLPAAHVELGLEDDSFLPSTDFHPQGSKASANDSFIASATQFLEDYGENSALNAKLALEKEKDELNEVWFKTNSGLQSRVIGGSKILSPSQIDAMEEVLPSQYQGCDWQLVYRMSLHGSSLRTLLHKAKSHNHCLLVVQDHKNTVLGALLTVPLSLQKADEYYGNGTMAVWSFGTANVLKYYPWSYKNSYFLLSSDKCLGIGGGGNYAIYLDGDLNKGTSGRCETFNSPCLASEEEFTCFSCELFVLKQPMLA